MINYISRFVFTIYLQPFKDVHYLAEEPGSREALESLIGAKMDRGSTEIGDEGSSDTATEMNKR